MRFRLYGWTEIACKGEQMMEETFFDISRPNGCTCPPGNTRVVMFSHDYIDIEVSKDCLAHAVLMRNMNYDQYTKLKREYLSDRERSDGDRKLLRSDIYSDSEKQEIFAARKRVQEAMEKLRVLGATWRSFLMDRSNDSYMEIAQYVNKVRYERNKSRSELRDAERDYRMTVEVPFLRRWKLRKIGANQLSGVVHHDTAHERPKKFKAVWAPAITLDPMYQQPFDRKYSAEYQGKMRDLYGEIKKLISRSSPLKEVSLLRNARKG